MKSFPRDTCMYGLPVHKVYGWCLKGTQNLEKDSRIAISGYISIGCGVFFLVFPAGGRELWVGVTLKEVMYCSHDAS